MNYDLERFKQAQESGFPTAVRELRAGRKRSHWIWYVFPQLRGLGQSWQALRYGLDGIGEAHAYLRDPLLRSNYREAVSVVHEQLGGRAQQLDVLMGAWIDAKKIVSSLTLFEHVARTLRPSTGEDEGLDELARLASEVLAIAETQGYPRCEFTIEQIRASGGE